MKVTTIVDLCAEKFLLLFDDLKHILYFGLNILMFEKKF